MGKMLSIEMKRSQVRVMYVEGTKNRKRVLSCFRFELPAGLVEDGYIEDTKALGKILKEELQKRNLSKVKRTYFSVYSTRIGGKEVQLPYVPQKKILDMVEVNASEYFPVDISQYVLAYDVLDVIEEKDDKKTEKKEKKKKNYQLMVYAVPRSLMTCYQQVAEEAGIELVGLNYSNNSVYQIIRKNYETGVHMMMKIEEKETVITIMRDGKLSLQRTLSYGMESALEVLATYPIFKAQGNYSKCWELLFKKNCIYPSLDPEKLELYKETDLEELWEGKREVTESLRYLIGNISRIMDYYISRNVGVEFDSISYAGLGCEVKGLGELFTEELGQAVLPVKEVVGVKYDTSLSEQKDYVGVFLAGIGGVNSPVNIIRNDERQKKKQKENLNGAWLIFGAGMVASFALAGTSMITYNIQKKEQARLNQEISSIQDVEDIYQQYMEEKSLHTQLEDLYQYTTTPNEKLLSFIEELEAKMPSSIRMDSFSSTGSEVNFTAKVSTKEEAAKVLIELRTFESIQLISTSGITEDENGEVSFTVTANYVNSSSITQELEEAQ